MNVPGARDMQLMERGWEHKDGWYRLPGCDWRSRLDARIAEGLDAPPKEPARITITSLSFSDMSPPIVIGRLQAGSIQTGFSVALADDEHADLLGLIERIAARLDQESRQ